MLGTIALYSPDIHEPTRDEMLLIDRAASLAGIAIERQRSEEALQRSATNYRILVEAASDGIFTIDRSHRLLQANARWSEMLGYDQAEMLGLRLEDFLCDRVRDGAVGDVARLIDDRLLRVEWPFQRRDGTHMLGEVNAVVLPSGRMQGIVRDVTDQRRLEAERLRQQAELARTDPLTGVQNRRAYQEQGDQYFSLAVRHKLPIVAALMDVDRFKRVNDTLGHAEGDRVLRDVGEVLSCAARTSDVVARVGGDEFGFILLGVDEAGADVFFRRLVHQLDERMRARNRSVDFSIGAAAYSGGIPTREVAMGQADGLLYLAKRNGGNQIVTRTFSSRPSEKPGAGHLDTPAVMTETEG